MKNFIDWCKDQKLELPINEKKIRTGIRVAMPSGYVQHEYPDAYFGPTIATHALNLQNLDRYVKDKAPPDNAP